MRCLEIVIRRGRRRGKEGNQYEILSTVPPMYALSVCVCVQREGSGATDESAQADAANQKEVKIPPTLFPFMEGCPNSFLLSSSKQKRRLGKKKKKRNRCGDKPFVLGRYRASARARAHIHTTTDTRLYRPSFDRTVCCP